MKPEELSIRNYIGYKGSPNIVTGIKPPYPGKDPYYSNTWLIEINPPDCFWVRLDDIYPLELDLDWMERLGFKKEERWDQEDLEIWYHKEGVDLYKSSTLGEFCFATYTRYSGAGFKGGFLIDKVHRLQNLYKALTQKELK